MHASASLRKTLITALLAISGVLLLFLTGCQSSVQPLAMPPNLFREIGYEDAVELSKNENKPLFLYFDGDWAKDRQKLVSRVLGNTTVAPLLRDRTISLRIEIVDLPDIAKTYRVTSVPLLLLIAPDGHEINRWSSTPKAEPFAIELNALISGTTATEYQKNILKPSDLVGRHNLAVRLITDGQYADALKELLWLYYSGIGQNVLIKKKLDVRTVIQSLGKLKDLYPATTDTLIDLREREKQNILNTPNNTIAGRKLAEILQALANTESTLTLYRELPLGKAKDIVRNIAVVPAFVKQHDYQNAANALPVEQALLAIDNIKELNMFGRGLVKTLIVPIAGTEATKLLIEKEQLKVLQKRAYYFEIYAGADRVDEARQVATAILKDDRLKQAPLVLRESAHKVCGNQADAFLQKLALPELTAKAEAPSQLAQP